MAKRARIAATIAVAAAVTLLACSPACAATWTQLTAPPGAAPNGELLGVSCATADQCMAVGSTDDPAGTQVPLAELRTASGWTIEPFPAVPGADASELDDVSCPSLSLCVAVGRETDAGEREPLAATWNGSGWTVASLPAGPHADGGELAAVSCVSVTACQAVGAAGQTSNAADQESAGTGLAMSWDGTSWSLEPLPPATGTLTRVSCAGTSLCMAVGWANTPSAAVLRFDGSSWIPQALGPSLVAAADPSSPVTAEDVSCTLPATCTVVGDQDESAFAVRWNAGTWTYLQDFADANGEEYALRLACLSGGACTALLNDDCYEHCLYEGSIVAATFGALPESAVTSTRFRADLSAIACAASAACLAVGAPGGPPVAEISDAGTWHGATPIDPPGGTALSAFHGIACRGVSDCTAVGSGDLAARGLAEHWDGSAWALQSTPLPASGLGASLSAVACPSAHRCIAVGSRGIEERGVRWSLVKDVFKSLVAVNAVGCLSTACVAVGGDVDDPDPGPMPVQIERRGGIWRNGPRLTPRRGAAGALDAIACLHSECVATGQYGAGGRSPLAAILSGGRWRLMPFTQGYRLRHAALDGVACTAPTFCVAVGDRGTNPHKTRPLVERWNGHAWHVMRQPDPEIGFEGVACASATMCVAVGVQSTPGPTGTSTRSAAALSFDGHRWTRDQLAVPGELNAVACPSVRTCYAVGGGAGVAPLALVRRS